jgi:Flp pilus assembly protein TadD
MVGRRGLGSLVGLLAAAAAVLAVWFSRPSPPPNRSQSAHVEPSPDPRLTFAGRWRNVHPDVAYTGSERCGGCHRQIANDYARHPMGQSLAALDDPALWPKYAPPPRPEFEAVGMHYHGEERGDGLWHVESKRDATGEIAVQAERVRYGIGSGTRGRSYLIEHDGRLYQSPISWFAEEKRWDLSPGYRTKQSHFTRAVTEACLFCHANRVVAVPETINRYRPPIFEGHAIGCERCHGPGELHVRRQEGGEEYSAPDDTIVEPGRLEPRLRDAVCEQCHLQGGQRILKHGRTWFDYRPGLPWDAFVTTFVRKDMDLQKSVGQFEQLLESRCYQESRGKLGCISCHDPHRAPAPSEKATFYRVRCMNCHDAGGSGCRLPLSERQAQGDSCIGCHMPRTGSVNVVHVSITDHRIVRRAESANASRSPWRPMTGEAPLALFRQVQAQDQGELDRDLGIALGNVALLVQDRGLAGLALPLLRSATDRDDHDIEAWQCLAHALMLNRESKEALATVETTLAWAPNNEASLFQAASLAMTPETLDKAVQYWKRLIVLNPDVASFYGGLTNAHALRGEWPEAAAAAEQVVRLNPTQAGPRISLIQALLRSGQRDRADREFLILSRMQPANLEEVRRWFAK